MLDENPDMKNALQDDNARWPDVLVPYVIDKTDFCK
jgi:hypothetical protein